MSVAGETTMLRRKGKQTKKKKQTKQTNKQTKQTNKQINKQKELKKRQETHPTPVCGWCNNLVFDSQDKPISDILGRHVCNNVGPARPNKAKSWSEETVGE